MPTLHTLPDNPRLEHLRQQARTLQRAVRSGDSEAVGRVLRQHPDGVPDDRAAFNLSTAQLVIAREYGFPSWPRLRHYLGLVAAHGFDTTPARRTAGDPGDEVCRLACLSYDADDGPDRWARARRVLAEHPAATREHIWAAATAADPPAVRRLLNVDPTLARRRGGPYGWTPLFHLAYSRLDPAVPADSVLTVARLLLAAGANPNDSQALYNRQFGPDNDHLELLLAYGLGTGVDYPWRARLGDLLDQPAELLRVQLRWAVWHNLLDRVQLLVRHGVDFRSPYRTSPGGPAWLPDDQHTAIEIAALCGNTAIVDYLRSQGAAPPRSDPADDLIAAAFRVDRATVERLQTAHPGLAAALSRTRPGLIVWAAANGRAETVAILAALGFDPNARGRGDVPVEGGSATALHHAAARGDVALVRLLLSLGADPGIRDGTYHATPLDWARHFEQSAVVGLLSPPG